MISLAIGMKLDTGDRLLGSIKLKSINQIIEELDGNKRTYLVK